VARTRKPVATTTLSENQTSVSASAGSPALLSANYANGISDAERAAQQALRQEYVEFRKHYMEREQHAYESFDKAILALSGSAFTFSLAMVQVIAATRQQTWLLGGAWGCWIGAMLLTLISFLCSQLAFRQQIDALDQQYYPTNGSPLLRNIPDSLTAWLNWFSGLAFIAGAVFIAIFVYFNLPA
jgi:hypothetical protein